MTHLPNVRSDSLAEKDADHFPDHGCRYAPRCLTCPLPLCVFDDPGWKRRERLWERDREILRRLRRGEAIPEIAALFNVSDRAVYRVRERGRDGDLTDTEFKLKLPAWAQQIDA